MYIQNEHNTAIYQHFTTLRSTTFGTIFSADVWINGGQVIFHYKTWCILVEAFASKNNFCKLICLLYPLRYFFKETDLPSTFNCLFVISRMVR